MKNNFTIPLFSIFLLAFFFSATAQERKLNKAGDKYEHLDYVDAQKIYLAVAEKGYESEELFTKLANTYYFNAQYADAAKWYGRLFEINANQQPNLLLRYSQALKATGDHLKAEELYNTYVTTTGTDPNAKKAMDYLSLVAQNSGRYQIRPIDGIYDKEKISFGHTKVGDKLIYATTNDKKSVINTKSAWDGLSFLSLYELELDQENVAIAKPNKLTGKLSSKFHESTPVFTKDGNTMYLTRNNLTYKNKKNDQNLKIYRFKKEGDQWQKPEELHFNSDLYSSAHPALSPDETKLYFSSDRPGGLGESDLYVTTIAADGTIGSPVNLGPEINTSGKETFPFVSEKNELYFSSDGHFGLGGLDVFYVKIEAENYGTLLNVGAPVNTYADDFAFAIDEVTKRGFVSSNRSETEGTFVYDNIYSFIETEPIVDVFQAMINGYVTDKQTGLPLAAASITLSDSKGEIFSQLTTDEKGYYEVETNKFEAYFITAKKEGYDTDGKVSKANLETQQIDFQLQQNKVAITTGMDLAEVLNIPMIYFDFDKSNIRPDAQVELEKVLAVLKEIPQLKLNIRSHTDSRGNDAYNKLLSQKRATSTLDYLISKGIDPNRLKSEGLGETELINKCTNGVNCSEADHQKNRRSEFIVID